MADADARAAESRLNRPDMALAQGVWRLFLAVWGGATEEEQARLMPLLVERVELKEKERGTVRLAFAIGDPRSNYALTAGNQALPSNRPCHLIGCSLIPI